MVDNANKNPFRKLSLFWNDLKGKELVIGGSTILFLTILFASLYFISSNFSMPLSASHDKNDVAQILSQETLKKFELFDDPVWVAQFSFEEYIKAKIDGLLNKIVGVDHFYTTVQVLMAKESTHAQIKNISIGVVIDKSVLDQNSDVEPRHPITESIKKEVASQLSAIIRGYDVPVQAAVDFVEFQNPLPQKEVDNWGPIVYSLFLPVLYILLLLTAIGVGIALIIYLFRLQNKNEAPYTASQGEKMIKDNIEDILADIEQRIEKNPEEFSLRYPS